MQHKQQHTIRDTISFKGIGIHTGIHVHGTLLPMPVDSGIQFQRMDLPNMPIIEALVGNVIATEKGTVLAKEGVQVATVEHLLAAIVAWQIDNICIQLDGPEVPDLDGSALAFFDLLLQGGLLEQEAPRKFFQLKEKFVYDDHETGSRFEVYPATNYRLHCTLAYERWPLENQYATLDNLGNFKQEIAPARTFCYLDEIEAMYQNGLVQGANPNHVVIFSDLSCNKELLQKVESLSGKKICTLVEPSNPISPKLRYVNEPARHKLLDLIGDVSLLGRPLQGQIFAHKPGHGPNTRFAAALRKFLIRQEAKGAPICDLSAAPLFDIQQITKMLPHRYPFQLVDKVMHLDDRSIIGLKNVTINEPFFQGHFPGTPIMPGVLQVEALAQVGGILVLHKVADPENYLTYFLSIDSCKFRRMVVPGDSLLLHCQLLTDIKFSVTDKQSIGIAQVKGRVFVGENLACEAVLLAQIVKQNGI